MNGARVCGARLASGISMAPILLTIAKVKAQLKEKRTRRRKRITTRPLSGVRMHLAWDISTIKNFKTMKNTVLFTNCNPAQTNEIRRNRAAYLLRAARSRGKSNIHRYFDRGTGWIYCVIDSETTIAVMF